MPKPIRTVLCVDDDADDREVVCFTINEIDPSLEVVHAENGLEAIAYLSQAKESASLPCLVILDINMPKMDGKKTLTVIKEDEKLQNLPVVIFSTSSSEKDRSYCAQLGVELVTKPSNMTQMRHEVKRLLQPCIDA
ncbi:MAG: response regulator [Bacteroidota bacterium]|nr:response regulator [Bacteroidota bacterium]